MLYVVAEVWKNCCRSCPVKCNINPHPCAPNPVTSRFALFRLHVLVDFLKVVSYFKETHRSCNKMVSQIMGERSHLVPIWNIKRDLNPLDPKSPQTQRSRHACALGAPWKLQSASPPSLVFWRSFPMWTSLSQEQSWKPFHPHCQARQGMALAHKPRRDRSVHSPGLAIVFKLRTAPWAGATCIFPSSAVVVQTLEQHLAKV